ncbi:MAG: glucose-6-phosphate isomerase [Paludibacteraceae bacterium]|nr:glucose-6-phosphate isomerase [Paludibacteraceae bacterium]
MILDNQNMALFVSDDELKEAQGKAVAAMQSLVDDYNNNGDWLGWMSIAADIRPQIDDIEKCASKLRKDSDAVIICGIGGSYLGAYAVITALQGYFDKNKPEILFAGNSLSQDYLIDLCDHVEGRKYSVVCISKSGTTMETAIAFRVLRNKMEDELGMEWAKEHIICITDAEKGALHDIAAMNGYATFEVPNNIGGRYSVLSAVGLLPIAIAGFDIRQLVAGAFDFYRPHRGVEQCEQILNYASMRCLMSQKGKKVENFVCFEPKLKGFSEWWKQLFGESEGKDGKGLFPTSVTYTTDLHSLGQYVQQGDRILFETVLSVEKGNREIEVPKTKDNIDNMNRYSWYTVGYINSVAEKGTVMAHVAGGVPTMRVVIPKINEYHLGQLIYFFELACAVSCKMTGVNPFDQPGVEDYKANIRKFLK